jgi:beta-N-acetylhexosaminidase
VNKVRFGLEVLRDSSYADVRGKGIGLMTNPSAVDSSLESAYRILTRADKVNVVALFSAEHGLSGAADAGEKVASNVDPRTGVPIYSLYGETYKPTPRMLRGLDAIVCDVQDVGVRFYTYTWTISHILEAAGEAAVEVIVLDRPNPLGGVSVDGGSLDTEQSSLVGRFPEPIQHGLTIGEHLRLINDLYNPTPAPLTVIKCDRWKRFMKWGDTRRIWIPTSPNMAHMSTVLHYPGACLVEGTNLSEGRGTPLPFEIVGAPFVDPFALAYHLNAQNWDGVIFSPMQFTPSASKHSGENCGGVQAHIVDVEAFQPIRVWLGVILAIRALYPTQFAWNIHSFDRLIGSSRYREAVELGASLAEITTNWTNTRDDFLKLRERFLLYD